MVFSTGYVLSDQGMDSYYHFKKALGSSHFVHSCNYQHCDSPPKLLSLLGFSNAVGVCAFGWFCKCPTRFTVPMNLRLSICGGTNKVGCD